jgi:hypothetical protein
VATRRGSREQQARQAVLRAVARHFDAAHGAGGPFRPGMRIPYGGRVFDRSEVENLVDASLDFWLTAGRYAAKFEAGLAVWHDAKDGRLLFVESDFSYDVPQDPAKAREVADKAQALFAAMQADSVWAGARSQTKTEFTYTAAGGKFCQQ